MHIHIYNRTVFNESLSFQLKKLFIYSDESLAFPVQSQLFPFENAPRIPYGWNLFYQGAWNTVCDDSHNKLFLISKEGIAAIVWFEQGPNSKE